MGTLEDMERRSFIQSFVWAAGGALVMILFLLLYGAFAHRFVEQAPLFSHSTLTIQRARGPKLSLDVEIAFTPQQKSYGLMFRRSLPEHAGMLFIWNTDQPLSFWMKNTILPLDMLFVRHDGVIVKIASHTEPFSLKPISSEEPVRGVIEINGGAAARLGIETGDKVLFPGFFMVP